jgi:ribosomal protein S12 methylthiotransferase
MKTKTAPQAGATVGVISLGCAKNLVDSEHLIASLLRAGLTLTPDPDKADLLLINTCAFIHDAREEAIDAVLEACRRKEKGTCRGVIVTGCLPQRYRQQLVRAIPEADAFLGLDALDRVGDIALRILRGEGPIRDIPETAERLFEPGSRRVVLSGGPYAYIKIAEGCDHRCGFCAIPGIRGRHRSRSIDSLAAEAEDLLGQGIRELNLISQDTTHYGRDRSDGADLPALLQRLGRIGGRFWIRVLYGYPTGITDRLLETMGSIPQVCRYLDVPVQHCDPAVLRAMRRGGTIRAVAELPARARARLPGVVLRTTCLVGHPGETEAAFGRLGAYVKESAFDHLGVFAFSPEEGTPAAGLRSRPRAATAERRREALLDAQQAVLDSQAPALIGARDELLVEKAAERAGGRVQGRTRRQAPEVDGQTLVAGAARAKPGNWLSINYSARRGIDWLAAGGEGGSTR